MHFLLLLCIASLSGAFPQYFYNPPLHTFGGAGLNLNGAGINNQFSAGTAAGASVGTISNTISTTGITPNKIFGNTANTVAQNHQVIVTKDIYVHAAPEEHVPANQLININAPARKHYRIIFIKAPHQTHKASLALAQAHNEEKTLIYVLSKQTDSSDIQTYIKNNPTLINKPEVYFIKYKTPAEAVHAQQVIKAQFDKIGGPSTVHNEGISPVHSVVGALGGLTSVQSHGSSSVLHTPAPVLKNQYLPSFK